MERCIFFESFDVLEYWPDLWVALFSVRSWCFGNSEISNALANNTVVLRLAFTPEISIIEPTSDAQGPTV